LSPASGKFRSPSRNRKTRDFIKMNQMATRSPDHKKVIKNFKKCCGGGFKEEEEKLEATKLKFDLEALKSLTNQLC
jgi:hypothetical protein